MDWEDGYDMFDNDDIDDSLIVEGTRGLDQPVTAEQRALRRRLRIIARRMQEDPTFNRDDYSTLLIEDFGLPEGSDEYVQYMSYWTKIRS
jgi:hypothetical protein